MNWESLILVVELEAMYAGHCRRCAADTTGVAVAMPRVEFAVKVVEDTHFRFIMAMYT